ncbi:unnamed protein product [Timema podura]|uniref:Uncharacterized protein n=1 Tax=Timema podura TaxID=61482 RepID=A0ABN7NKB1_TIMPD|nr:unnamed protein product [Timema podura]
MEWASFAYETGPFHSISGRFARKDDLDKRKTVSLLNILYMTHKYFTTSPWRRAFETYNFLRESLLLHTVMRPPKSTEIFTPQECKDALIHFTREYISNLPLVHLITLPTYHVHFNSSMDSLVLNDSSQLRADGFEKLPDQIMHPYAEPYDLSYDLQNHE